MGILSGKNGKKALSAAAFALALYFIFKYLFPLLAPFLISFLLVYLCNPWLKKVQKKTHIRKEILLGGLLLLSAALLLCGIWGLVSWGTVHAEEFGEGVRAVQEKMDGMLRDCCVFLERKFGIDAGDTRGLIVEKTSEFLDGLGKDALPRAAKRSLESLKGLASAAAFLGVGFIAALLLCRDYESMMEQLEGNQMLATGLQFAEKAISMIGGYVKAQAIILCAISLIAVLGLLIGRIEGAAILGVLAGLLDALPFIGTGIILLPTAFWQLLSGNFWGAGMAALSYVLCIAARELLEPRLLGKQTGMYPVVMLFSVYAGIRVFGLTGIFLGPLYAALFKEGIDCMRGTP